MMTIDLRGLATNTSEATDATALAGAVVMCRSMDGKVAMHLALTDPARVTRPVVADIAPVPYPSHFGAYAQAMLTVEPEMTRAEADAALAVPDAAVRGFLLHNFQPGRGWRIGLREIADSLGRVETWETVGVPYDGPTLFVTGERSDYVSTAYHSAILQLFPLARLRAIALAGHWLHAEQPTKFNMMVFRFLELDANSV